MDEPLDTGAASEALLSYLEDRRYEGPELTADGCFTGAAGGSACGDLVRISIRIVGSLVSEVSVASHGCGPTRAATAAAAELVVDQPVLVAAAIGESAIADRLGGLSTSHSHASLLAADALGRALSAAASSGIDLASPPDSGSRTLVALSGGVDSTAAALLERQAGREVAAVTVKLWADPATDGTRSCCSPEAVLEARRLAHALGLPHLTLDLRERFRGEVVGPFSRDHAAGLTPNPCVLCNGDVRIDEMAALASRIGADRLATGHYARLVDDGDGPLLSRPADEAKDQTHMLSGLRPSTLARLHFPLAESTKPEARRLVAEAGLERTASGPESQDLCFLAGTDKLEFLRTHAGLDPREGEIVDSRGRVLGKHRGHQGFTVGQRRGLGLGGGTPLYVTEVDPVRNRVVVGPRSELERSEVRLVGVRLHRPAARIDSVRLRHHQAPIACSASDEDGELRLDLSRPATGVAPGQTASLLDGGMVLGHGTIATA